MKTPGGSRRFSFTGMGKSAKKLEPKDEVEDEVVERRKSVSMVQQAAAEEQERLVDEGERMLRGALFKLDCSSCRT